ITYRRDDLRAATKAIQEAEAALAGKSDAAAEKLLDEARRLVAAVPISAAEASEEDFNAIFKKKRKKATTKVTGRQAEVEQDWDSQVKANYAKAQDLAEQAKSLL
ncbi:MAG: ABC transporter substrate-binding protein, partial [Rhodospirillales bacterium]|nr:ABC transporter substrate-binding protein [Rhodospirillales bacterium]